MPVLSTVAAVANPYWFTGLGLLLICAAASGWRLATVFGGGPMSRAVFALMIGAHIPAIVVLLPIPFSAATNIAVGVALTLLSFLVPKHRTSSKDSLVWLAGTMVLLLWTVGLAARSQLLTHYDYYLNSNLLSLDLARSGSPASAFAVAHDLHNWVLIQLTTTVSLDAIEMQALQSNTNFLPKLLQLLAILGCASLIARKSAWGSVVFMLFGAAALFDQSVQFRPHIFVGLFVLLACLLRMTVKAPEAGIGVSSAFLALSKRDGLVLAPFLFVLTRLRMNLWAAGSVLIVCLVGAAFIRIGGRSPLLPLIEGLGSTETLLRAASKLLDPGVLIAFATLGLLSVATRRSEDQDAILRSCLMLGVLLLLVVGGALVLGGAGFWNLGTDDRKVLYIVMPAVVGLLAVTWPIFQSGKKLVFCLYLALVVTALGWSSWQFALARKVTPAWSEAAVESTDFLRQVVPEYQSTKIGLIDVDGDDLAPSILGDLDLYKFQFFVAYDGADLKIAQAVEDLADRDVIFVPPTHSSFRAPSGWKWRRPFGVYAALVKANAKPVLDEDLLVKTRAGTHLAVATIATNVQSFAKNALEREGIGLDATTFPSGDTNLDFTFASAAGGMVSLASSSLPDPEPEFVTFRRAVSGASLPDVVAIVTEGGRRQEFPVDTLLHYDTYYLAVPSFQKFTIEFVSSSHENMGLMALRVHSKSQ